MLASPVAICLDEQGRVYVAEEYRFNRGSLADVNAATFRAWDTEAPVADRQGFARVTGELPPISRKVSLGEEDRLRLRARPVLPLQNPESSHTYDL